MRANNYDTEAFRFGIISFRNKYSKPTMAITGANAPKEVLEREHIIDFDRIDGLTIEDLDSYPEVTLNNHIFFVMYDNITGYKDNIRYVVGIDKEKVRRDQTLGEIMNNYIETNYGSLEPNIRNRANCFLQRYIYGTYSGAQDHIEHMSNR